MATCRSQRAARWFLALSATALTAVTLGSSVGYAEPTRSLTDVKRQVDALHHQAEQATERYDEERIRLQQLQKRVSTFQTKADEQQARVTALQKALGKYADVSFRMGTIDPTIQLMFSEHPDRFLQDSAVLSRLTDRQIAILNRVLAGRKELDTRKIALDKELQTLAKSREKLLAEKNEIESKLGKAQKILDSLEAEEREKLQRASRSSSRTGSTGSTGGTYTGPATGDVRKVLDYAFAQLGKPYVYAAAGPDAFDCSGLTMMAWRQAGVYLPHSSRMQYDQGRKVAKSELQPGDLVYYYYPISHVAIYIGNGEIIHATHPGSVVSRSPMSEMPYAGATRP